MFTVSDVVAAAATVDDDGNTFDVAGVDDSNVGFVCSRFDDDGESVLLAGLPNNGSF